MAYVAMLTYDAVGSTQYSALAGQVNKTLSFPADLTDERFDRRYVMSTQYNLHADILTAQSSRDVFHVESPNENK